MAGIATHIILTDKVFGQLFEDKDRKEFILGTSFPDIRYLGVIKREETHLNDLTLSDVAGEQDSFMSGLKFHSLVDEAREQFVNQNNLYSSIPVSKFSTQAFKIYEDLELYSRIDNWDKYISYFDDLLNKELDFGIAKEQVLEWHKLIQKYLSDPNKNLEKTLSKLGFNDPSIQEMQTLVEQMSKHSKVQAKTSELYDRIVSIVK